MKDLTMLIFCNKPLPYTHRASLRCHCLRGQRGSFFLLQRSSSAVAAVLRLQPTPTHIMSRRPFISPNLQPGFVWSAAAAERWPSFFRHWLARPLPRMNRPSNGAGGNVTVYSLAFPRWSLDGLFARIVSQVSLFKRGTRHMAWKTGISGMGASWR